MLPLAYASSMAWLGAVMPYLALELQRQESQRLAIAKTTVDVAASLLAAIEDV